MSDERGEMVAWLEDEKKLSANGRRTAMLDRIIAALAARAPAEPVAWVDGVRENIEMTLASMVGCFMACERCGEENDCSDMDAVMFARKALAALTASPPSAPEEREDIAKVLEGFDKGVFVRSTDNDHESGWAVKLLPYIGALQRIAARHGTEEGA